MLNFSRFKPAVPKCWLFAFSGVLWSTVGFMMVYAAVDWLAAEEFVRGLGIGLTGLILAVLAYRKSFGKIARKNIRRLQRMTDRRCLFAFQAWRSYIVIFFMIALGLILRHSSIPKSILAVVYVTVGGALFLSSFLYYRHLVRIVRVSGRRHTHHPKSH